MDADRELMARAEARIGKVLREKYRVDSVLGVGGMAVVYAVTHRNQKRFALKILHPELSLRTDIRQRFQREGYAANTLNHPGAVAILDDDVAEDGSAFLVMELLDGAPVETVWESLQHRMSPSAVLAIAHQLLDVLAAAHAKSIVHRDIKPANLFLTRDGTIKVLDFGIARVRDATSGMSTTSTGTTLGTPGYMAPEQAIGRTGEIDGQTDVWAVGATMFSLISGQLVHAGESAAHVVVQSATEPARSLAAVCPEVPERVVSVVDRALAFAKADRWPSAMIMRDAVAAAHEAVLGAVVSRTPLVELMDEWAKHSQTRKAAHAPTMPDPSGEASAPTLPFDGGSDPARAVSGGAPFSSNTANPVESSPMAHTLQRPAGGRWLRVAIAVVAVLGIGGGAAWFGFRRHQPPVQSAIAASIVATPAPPAPAASSVAAPLAPSSEPTLKTAKLGVSPPTASVEVDGQPAPVSSGMVDVSGSPGSMHIVHVIAGKRDGTYPVLLTDNGPVPSKVELSVAPPAFPGAPPPRKPPPGAAPAPSTAPQNFSRTME
jgi:serine/threonine-protein kinase